MGVGCSDGFDVKVVETADGEERRYPVLGAVVTVTEAARALRCGRTREPKRWPGRAAHEISERR